MLHWVENPANKNRGRAGFFAEILDVVRAEQRLHPGAWALIAEYTRRQTGKDTAYRLKNMDRWADFEFRSAWDNEREVSQVFARYTGRME